MIATSKPQLKKKPIASSKVRFCRKKCAKTFTELYRAKQRRSELNAPGFVYLSNNTYIPRFDGKN